MLLAFEALCVLIAGFVLFFILLLCIIRSPPTPLALTRQDAHQLWDTVAFRVWNASAKILHYLEQSTDPKTGAALPSFQHGAPTACTLCCAVLLRAYPVIPFIFMQTSRLASA